MADASVDIDGVLNPLADSSIGSEVGPAGCATLIGGVVELNGVALGGEAYSQRAQSGSTALEGTSMPEFAPNPWKMVELHAMQEA